MQRAMSPLNPAADKESRASFRNWNAIRLGILTTPRGVCKKNEMPWPPPDLSSCYRRVHLIGVTLLRLVEKTFDIRFSTKIIADSFRAASEGMAVQLPAE